jgi:hypothetical protein
MTIRFPSSLEDAIDGLSAAPSILLKDPDPDVDALTTAIAQHSDWLPQAEYEVRGLMLADRQIERQIEKAGQQLKTLVELYKAKIEALESNQQYFRRGIEAYIKLVNNGEKVSWPDVGVAFMATVKEKIVVVDEDATIATLKAEGMLEPIKSRESIDKRVFDTIYNARPSVFKECVKVLPETKELRIRKA